MFGKFLVVLLRLIFWILLFGCVVMSDNVVGFLKMIFVLLIYLLVRVLLLFLFLELEK